MVLLVLLLVIGAAGCGDAGTVITRLAVGDPGPDAYTIVSGTDKEDVGRLAAAGGAKPGDEPGLYGGTRQDAVCDKEALVDFLEGDPAKATAWAAAQGVPPGGIAEFVDTLTPVLLRADTLVTNHGYRDGKATKTPAVLQAGIAVMVNARGVPVVKCNCGNPLSEPEVDVRESDFTGASWTGFSPDKVTVVRPPAADVEELMLVDTEQDTAFDRPVGTEGESDGAPEPVPPAAASEPPSPPSDGPSTGTDGTGGTGTPGATTPAQPPTDEQTAAPTATETGEAGGTLEPTGTADPSGAQSAAPGEPDPATGQPADPPAEPPPAAEATQPPEPEVPEPEPEPEEDGPAPTEAGTTG
ncbi:DUF6777 domain-containing protein [Actinocorallia herbida]|uniref:DUF6777 domain-containing protein n=1 Tax=Actinocorallia herbida TaxID=58109 RepID=UPI000F4B4751|nr:DUF6777 domain-containing protein [Actinocorallia herbida]